MDRSVDEDDVGPLGAKAVGGFLPPVSGAVVHNPEDAAGGFIGLLAHDFAHPATHRRNAVFGFTTSEDLGAMDIPRSQVDPGAPAKILAFHAGGTDQELAAKSAVCGGAPECWSFRRRK